MLLHFNVRSCNISAFNLGSFNISAFNVKSFKFSAFNLTNCNISAFNVRSCNISAFSVRTLFDLQLDAQNSYLFTYNTFIKILYMFRALPCSSSGGPSRNCIYAASGIVTLCRWLSCAPVKKELVKKEPVHKTVICREWRYQRLHIYKLRRGPPEDEQSSARNM